MTIKATMLCEINKILALGTDARFDRSRIPTHLGEGNAPYGFYDFDETNPIGCENKRIDAVSRG